LNGNYGRTVWVLGKPGVVGRITGLTELAEDPNIVSILPRFALGDEITKEMESTERQILMRIYLVSDSIENLNISTRSIGMLLHVEDAYGQNLIQDIYCPEI
jgi:hypothetical protein